MNAPTSTGAPASASDAVAWKPGQHGYARETIVLEDEHQIVEVGVSPHGRIDLIVHRATDGGGFDDLTAHLTQKTAALVVAALTEAGAALAPPAVPESVRRAFEAAKLQELFVDGDKADVYTKPPGSSFVNEFEMVARCSCGPLWRRRAVAIAEGLNWIGALLATPSGRADTPLAGGGTVEGGRLSRSDLEPNINRLADWLTRHGGVGSWAASASAKALLLREDSPVRLPAAPAAPEPAAGGGREIVDPELSALADAASASEQAYGTLWRLTAFDESGAGYAHDARKVLLASMDKDGQRRGIAWATRHYGPLGPNPRFMLSDEDRMEMGL